ncbi:MAG: exodeoxyribonuclease V subunit alpha [Lautropia sp.]|nr:exodeoxyribonuclease V subunit alpha [Lautropia sp.]
MSLFDGMREGDTGHQTAREGSRKADRPMVSEPASGHDSGSGQAGASEARLESAGLTQALSFGEQGQTAATKGSDDSVPSDPEGMLELLRQWHDEGWLRRIDLELARFLLHSSDSVHDDRSPAVSGVAAKTECRADSALVLLAAALCSWQLGRGHVCLDLQAAAQEPEQVLSMPVHRYVAPTAQEVSVPAPGALLRMLDPARWQAACAAEPDWVADGAAGELPVRPLVLAGNRLYLLRYWQYEQDVQTAILARLAQPGDTSTGAECDTGITGACVVDGQRTSAAAHGGGQQHRHQRGGSVAGHVPLLSPAPARLRCVLDRLFASSPSQREHTGAPAAAWTPSPDGVDVQARQTGTMLFDAAPVHRCRDRRGPGQPETAPVVDRSDAAKRPTDWQKIACALAARHRFGLITGGPGTGKTTTVLRLLVLLQCLAHEERPGQFLRIGLAAPTGKAAARLSSSISGAISKLPLDGLAEAERIRAHIPSSVSTLHRLLGSRPGSRHFRHDAGNPLPLDVLVIDEASMVDLEMMALVIHALPPQARLILLGDKDQLASVEAGAILGELCARAQDGHYRPETADWIRQVSGEELAVDLLDEQGLALDQSIAMLRHSHRFSANSGIGALADAVNHGATEQVRALWRRSAGQGESADIARIVVPDAARHRLRTLVLEGYAHYLAEMKRGFASTDESMDSGTDARDGRRNGYDGAGLPPAGGAMGRSGEPTAAARGHGGQTAVVDAWAARVLQAHTRFQLLCALRRGAWGVEQLNLQIARWLQARGLLSASEGWYPGRPVIVTRNDYELGLMNGDVGIALNVPEAGGSASRLRVAFPGVTDPAVIRWILPSRLQAVETVFAMTVHKAQGSEFEHAVLVMPAEMSPVLTRELVYTAITRARKRFTLCGPEGLDASFEATIQRRVRRVSGLMSGALIARAPAQARLPASPTLK